MLFVNSLLGVHVLHFISFPHVSLLTPCHRVIFGNYQVINKLLRVGSVKLDGVSEDMLHEYPLDTVDNNVGHSLHHQPLYVYPGSTVCTPCYCHSINILESVFSSLTILLFVGTDTPHECATRFVHSDVESVGWGWWVGQCQMHGWITSTLFTCSGCHAGPTIVHCHQIAFGMQNSFLSEHHSRSPVVMLFT